MLGPTFEDIDIPEDLVMFKVIRYPAKPPLITPLTAALGSNTDLSDVQIVASRSTLLRIMIQLRWAVKLEVCFMSYIPVYGIYR